MIGLYIPTIGRVDKQITALVLKEAGIDYKLVVKTKADAGNEPYIICKASGIKATRQYILEKSTEDKIIMLDDDLKFRKRIKDTGRFTKCEPKDIRKLLSLIEKLLDRHAHVGLVDEFMCNIRPPGFITIGRYTSLIAYNKKLFPKPWPKFRIEINEEHDFNLQLLNKGLRPAIITDYTKSTKFFADGGCNTWRTAEVEKTAHWDLAKLWPNFVSVVPNKYNMSKVGIRFNWKAIERSLIKKAKPW